MRAVAPYATDLFSFKKKRRDLCDTVEKIAPAAVTAADGQAEGGGRVSK